MMHIPYIKSEFEKNAEKPKANTIRSICNPYKRGTRRNPTKRFFGGYSKNNALANFLFYTEKGYLVVLQLLYYFYQSTLLA